MVVKGGVISFIKDFYFRFMLLLGSAALFGALPFEVFWITLLAIRFISVSCTATITKYGSITVSILVTVPTHQTDC